MHIQWVGIGEVKSSSAGEQLGSMLGSCVATVLWHPPSRFAVMNHILLPRRPPHKRTQPPDGRFAPESWRMMQARLARQGIGLRECVAYISGGACAIDGMENPIGEQNIAVMLDFLSAARISICIQHVGGSGNRTVRFEPDSGVFHVAHNDVPIRGVPKGNALDGFI